MQTPSLAIARSVYPVPRQRLAVLAVGDDGGAIRAVGRMARAFDWPVLAIDDGESPAWAVRVNRPSVTVLLGSQELHALRRRVEEVRRASRCLIVIVADLVPAGIVELLAAGADEVLPIDTPAQELGARLLALIRAHVAGPDPGARFLTAGELTVDLYEQTVRLGDAPLALSPTELRLLTTLMEASGRAVPTARLVFDVWGWGEAEGVNVLRIYVSRLRKKLGPAKGDGGWVRSVRGRGYAFVPPVIAASTWERKTGAAASSGDELLIMRRLAEKCELLSADSSAAQAADRIVAALVAEGTVDAVGLHLTQQGSLRLIAHRGFSAAWEQAARELQLKDPRFAASRAVVSAEPVQIVRLADRVYPGTTGLLSREGVGTYFFFPLNASGSVVGAMGVLRRSGEPFGPITISYLQAVADLCGVCLGPGSLLEH